jgi:hypothetical protein
MSLLRTLCALALPCLCQVAAAQAYKCTVNGTTSYQDKPCADGKGTTLDLPGAYSPPGTAAGDHTPQGIALNLSYAKVMVQRCPLGQATADSLDLIASALGPSLKSLGAAQLDAISAKAATHAGIVLASANRAAACKSIDGAIGTTFHALAQAATKPPARSAPRQKPTPTL